MVGDVAEVREEPGSTSELAALDRVERHEQRMDGAIDLVDLPS